MASSKGKEKLMERNSGKRKKSRCDDDKPGGPKRRNRAVLQLFDDSAYEDNGYSSSHDEDEDDFHINDFLEDEVLNDVKAYNEPVKVPLVPFIKEEEMDDVELESMVEERYGRGSTFIRYAEDGYDNREAVDRDENLPDFRETTLWKVKCMVGREKHSVHCLMQKYVDLQTLGTKLQIISAFSLDHVNGFIYIEARSQQDLYEACKGLPTVYVSRVTTVPPNQCAHVLSVRSKGCGITANMWARVKSGKYKGDLARIVAVNEARKKATVKLIPRIDLRVLAEKFGGGVPVKRNYTAIPPRLISSSELEEYRPLIQNSRDRDTSINFEVLDGMMLKDGYLYKKIAIDSLTVWGAMPTEDELLKFEHPHNNESMDLEFLTDLYGNANRKKKQCMKNEKGGEKGEGPSFSNMEYDFEVHDLVFFGKKDFGVIIGMEKDNFKIMKEGTGGPLVLTLPTKDLKRASFDKKLFTAQDGHMKKIAINDRVRVMDGLLKDKEGVVKRIYRGIIFLFNEREDEHNGYICFKSQKCEKGNAPGTSGFGESPSSPKTPLSTDKAWQGRETKSFNQEYKNAMFSVGQSLRIRVGPLKGYLCRVLAIRSSDVIVKLDSQHKILTVQSEHLSEVRGRSSTSVTGTSWPSFSASGIKLQSETGAATDTIGGDSGWAAADTKQVDSWGKQQDGSSISVAATVAANSWGKQQDGGSSLSNLTGSTWSQQVDAKTEEVHGRTEQKQSWGNQAGSSWNKPNNGSSWKGKDGGSGLNKPTGGSSWGKQVNDRAKSLGTADQNQGWGSLGGSSWKRQDDGPAWSKPAGGSSWGQQADANAERNNTHDQQPSWGKQDGGSWNKQHDGSCGNEGGSGGSSWNKDGGSSWSKPAGSSWGQADSKAEVSHERIDRNKSWGGQGSSSWSKPDGGPTWSKPAGGPFWDAKAEEPNKTTDRPQSVLKQGGGRSWNKQDGGSSWGKQSDANAKAMDDESVEGAEGGNHWSAAKPSDRSASASVWEMKSCNKTQSSGWGKFSSWNRNGAGNSTDLEKQNQNDSWDVKKTSEGGSSTGWGKRNLGKSSTGDPPENRNSAWSSKSDWGAGNDYSGSHEQIDNISRGRGRGRSWRGGSSTGRGKGNWGKSSTDDPPENQNSAWSSKSDWGAGNDYSGSHRQVPNISRGGGRGGSRRGGRGGRGGRGESDRGGFGGRGGSGRGGFRGRGGSFGGRKGSEQGGYGGRGRSDRGGFQGRGRSDQGGRSRGRSDQYGGYRNNRNDSVEEKTTSWSKSSWTADGGISNENKGNLNQGGAYGGQQKGLRSESQSKGNIDRADGDGGQRKSCNSGGSWWSKTGSNACWNQGSASGSGNAPGTWNKPCDKDGGNTEKVK